MGQLVVRDEHGHLVERHLGPRHALLRLLHGIRLRRTHVRALRRRIHLTHIHHSGNFILMTSFMDLFDDQAEIQRSTQSFLTFFD